MAGGPTKTPLFERGVAMAVAIGSLLAYVLALTAQAVTLKSDVDHVKATAVKIDTRVQAVETGYNEVKQDMREMKSDIGWIRRFLERRP